MRLLALLTMITVAVLAILPSPLSADTWNQRKSSSVRSTSDGWRGTTTSVPAPPLIRQTSTALAQPFVPKLDDYAPELIVQSRSAPPSPLLASESFIRVSDESRSPRNGLVTQASAYSSYDDGGGCDSCSTQGGCSDGSCGTAACGSCSKPGVHRTGFFGDFLYLRARDVDVAYAVEVDGPGAPPANQGTQVGPTAVVEQEFDPDYRVGFSWALDETSSVALTYMAFDTTQNDSISRTGTNDIRSLVTHPLVANAAADWLNANAELDVHFDVIDLDFRWLRCSGENYAVNFMVGMRYGRLEQNFRSNFVGTGTRSVNTDLIFEGGGLRAGLDFERHVPCYGVFIYGKSSASFVFGEYRGTYFQGASFDPTEISTSWSSARTVPVLDFELGLGWENGCGLRLSAGYMVQAWLNTVGTDDFIQAVHASDFAEVNSGLTLDGLAVRAAYAW